MAYANAIRAHLHDKDNTRGYIAQLHERTVIEYGDDKYVDTATVRMPQKLFGKIPWFDKRVVTVTNNVTRHNLTSGGLVKIKINPPSLVASEKLDEIVLQVTGSPVRGHAKKHKD